MTKIITLILGCCMIVNTGCHKAAELRDGVYEWKVTETRPDRLDSSSWFWFDDAPVDFCWTLTVMNGEALFKIYNKSSVLQGYGVVIQKGNYYLIPEKQPDGTLTAEVIVIKDDDEIEGVIPSKVGRTPEDVIEWLRRTGRTAFYGSGETGSIKLIIRNINPHSVEVEIVEGTFWHIFSGSGVYHRAIPLPPETQTLTLVREPSDKDKEKLIQNKPPIPEENEL